MQINFSKFQTLKKKTCQTIERHDFIENWKLISQNFKMSSKRILVSGHITSQIEAWQETSDTFCYGLVLGHFGGKELMVVHLARQGSL